MNDHENCKRQFIHLSRAWYAKSSLANSRVDDEVMIGMYHPEGGTTGEFAIRWSDVGGKSVPMLCVFDDAWDAMMMFRDVLEVMASVDDQKVTPERFCELLIECGVEDATPEQSPFAKASVKPDRMYSKPDSELDKSSQSETP